jgi:hypothetical protein
METLDLKSFNLSELPQTEIRAVNGGGLGLFEIIAVSIGVAVGYKQLADYAYDFGYNVGKSLK